MKRLPKVIHFDPDDETHIEFAFSTANLFAHIFNLPPFTDKAAIAKLVSTVLRLNNTNQRKPSSRENDKDTHEEEVEDDEVRIAQLTELLSSNSPPRINTPSNTLP